MKRVYISLALIFNIYFLNGQNYPTDIPSQFFQILEQQGISSGIDYLYTTNKWLAKDLGAKEKLKQKCNEFLSEDKVGKYVEKHLIKQRNFKRTLSYLSFMVNYDKEPYRFTFILYRPNRKLKWRVKEFWFDDELTDELVERGKLFMLADDEF